MENDNNVLPGNIEGWIHTLPCWAASPQISVCFKGEDSIIRQWYLKEVLEWPFGKPVAPEPSMQSTRDLGQNLFSYFLKTQLMALQGQSEAMCGSILTEFVYQE